MMSNLMMWTTPQNGQAPAAASTPTLPTAEMTGVVHRLNQRIARRGHISTTDTSFVRRSSQRHGDAKVASQRTSIAALVAKDMGEPEPKSTFVTVGDSPNGFGKMILWDPDDEALALLVYLNAGDDQGVGISGVRSSDSIELVSATGIASFAEDIENEGASALIGLIAAGAQAGNLAFGHPAAAPAIEAAEEYAKEMFEEKEVKTKRRDAFGIDPGSGHRARQEGGVLVSMPEAKRSFYSGNSDHRDRWIKSPGHPRDAAHMPDHVFGSFFLRPQSRNFHRAQADGTILITPWDHNFLDNFGYYRLQLVLRRGDGFDHNIE